MSFCVVKKQVSETENGIKMFSAAQIILTAVVMQQSIHSLHHHILNIQSCDRASEMTIFLQ